MAQKPRLLRQRPGLRLVGGGLVLPHGLAAGHVGIGRPGDGWSGDAIATGPLSGGTRSGPRTTSAAGRRRKPAPRHAPAGNQNHRLPREGGKSHTQGATASGRTRSTRLRAEEEDNQIPEKIRSTGLAPGRENHIHRFCAGRTRALTTAQTARKPRFQTAADTAVIAKCKRLSIACDPRNASSKD